MKLGRFGVELPIEISGGSWRVEYPVSVYPLMLARGNVRSRWEDSLAVRETTYGAGAHPVALRVLRATRAGMFSLGVAVGGVRFGEAVPTSRRSRWNASLDLEAGVRWTIVPRRTLIVGYQFNHISNGSPALHNPGLDSHMIRIGVQGT